LIPGPHRFAVRDNHGARKDGSCEKQPKVTDKQELRGFLGLCTHYRSFIAGFADIAKSLTRLKSNRHSSVPESRDRCPITERGTVYGTRNGLPVTR